MTMPISPEHARELARLIEHETKPDLVLIGAVALGHHVPLGRHTSDVDLAVVVSLDDITPLLESLGWIRHATMPHRWHGPANFLADVLPVTHALISQGSVSFDDDSSMSLVGFDLAMEHAVPVPLANTRTTLKVASLAAIVVLKIVAWTDRPSRTKDLIDLATILKNALDEDDERRWDEPLRSIQFDEQSAFFVGLEVAAIMRNSHRKVVDGFVQTLLDESGTVAAQMARAAGMRSEDADERVQRLVRAFARGVSAVTPPP